MGRGVAIAYLYPVASSLSSCNTAEQAIETGESSVLDESFPLTGISPSLADELLLAEGLNYTVLLKWEDKISEAEAFGYNNDYIAFLPDEGSDDSGILWVNHEYIHPLFVSGVVPGREKTKADVEKEQQAVGGSIVRIRKNDKGVWELVYGDEVNRRLTAKTPIPIIADRPVKGSATAIGTMGNCAGGVTPWGTILTCEENYQDYYGETEYGPENEERRIISAYSYGWEKFFDYPPEHYGWVVEVNPQTGEAKKLTGIGRYAHECATVSVASDGRSVAYSGDDKNDECLYKFIADEPGSLEKGKLYVANIESGKWLSLVYEEQEVLQQHFKDQTEVLIRCREAARLVGASLLDRPEDIEIDPQDGAVIVALTNNIPKGNYHGQLMRLVEKDNDPLSLEFEADILLAGGEETGFACPDNLVFDPKGNLWFTTDISGSYINTEHYKPFGNNGLYVVPMSGPKAGEVIQVASAPVDAELTGPYFSPDGRTLFLAVQHPGEYSETLDSLTSHWPEGGNNVPRPAVVCIQGEALDQLMS